MSETRFLENIKKARRERIKYADNFHLSEFEKRQTSLDIPPKDVEHPESSLVTSKVFLYVLLGLCLLMSFIGLMGLILYHSDVVYNKNVEYISVNPVKTFNNTVRVIERSETILRPEGHEWICVGDTSEKKCYNNE